jgi:hypothetical protein
VRSLSASDNVLSSLLGGIFDGVFRMQHFDDHDELTEEEASGGVKKQGVRIVLVVSLVLAIVLLSLSWMGMALYGTPD